ncbi:MAG: hypothetical protein V3W09_01925 [Nitrososphaerales archaeon]
MPTLEQPAIRLGCLLREAFFSSTVNTAGSAGRVNATATATAANATAKIPIVITNTLFTVDH